jgi:hypothetical protein
MTVWVVRAGEELRFLPWFDSEDVVGIGWSELPESPLRMTRQELASLMRATYLDAAAGTTANYTGQVWNFINTIALGDLVVVPLKASKTFRIGRIAGPAERREKLAELTAVRPVEWEAKEVPAETLAKDLRNALGSIMTVFRPRARAAERRIETVLDEGHDPGPDSGGEDRPGAWVFQANPKRFDLLQALDAGSTETWSVNQHRQDIQPGDRVWFRLTGPAAGVYAVGRVTSLPRPEASEFGDWQVDVTFESRIIPPLLRTESDTHPVLSAASALAGLMGTNLSLSAETDTQLEAITRLVGSRAGAVAVPDGRAWGLSSAGFPVGCATPVTVARSLRFQPPPVDPGMRFSRTRLTDALHRRCSAGARQARLGLGATTMPLREIRPSAPGDR